MKKNKKITLVIIAAVCAVITSVFAIVNTQHSTPLAPDDEQNTNSSSDFVSSTTEPETYISFEPEETKTEPEKVICDPPAEEKATDVPTTTKAAVVSPSTTKKAAVNSKPSTSKQETTTKKATPTTKPTTTKPTPTKPSTTKPTTTQPTTVAPGKILYYYTDGTTGYTPKPGAEYYSNGCWNIVSWGNTVTDEEIKEAHKNDSTEPWM